MTDIEIQQMPAFKRAYKKLYPKEKKLVDAAIRAIVENPKIGEAKKGDLSEVYVHKFKLNTQEILLAYEWNEKLRLLLCLGVHENFYRDLKKDRK